MRSHNSRACWNQQRQHRAEPFLSCKQTSLIQNITYQGPVQSYREQVNRQHLVAGNQVETTRPPRESNQAQNNNCETSL